MQTIQDLQPCRIITDQLQQDLLNRGKTPELPLLTMPQLNYKIWGIHKRKLLLIGARPSNGKSNFAINIAYDLALQNKKVMFLSLEMPKERIVERMFCLNANVNNIELLCGKYNDDIDIRTKYKKFQSLTTSWRLVIADCIGKDWQWMIENVFDCLDEQPDCVIIDHIQEIRGGQNQKTMMDEYISKMRECAIKYNFALILCSQINRVAADSDNKEPQLYHLKGSGYLEESADQVILLHWPYHYNKDSKLNQQEYSIHVAKNRDGLTGYIKMSYYAEFCKIRDFEEPIIRNNDIVTADQVNWNA